MKKIFSIVIAALMLLAFAACSTAKTPSSSVSTASSTSNVSGTPTIDAIKASGKLVMLTNATFPPFEYSKEGVIQGVDPALAQLIADELGVELVIEDMNFDLLIDAMNSGKGNIVAAGMSIREDRQKIVDFSVPYIHTPLVILVPEGSDIASSADLAGKTVAVQESTTSHLYLQDNAESLGVKAILPFKSAVEAGLTLVNGKCDAVLIDKPTGDSVAAANPGVVVLDEIVSEEQYAMAVAKNQEDFLAVVDKVLQKAIDDGLVDDLFVQHMEAAK